jgi:hypothetical protein
MVSAAHMLPPEAGSLARTLVFETVSFQLPAFRHQDFVRGRSPANPRAPPAVA